MIRTFESRWPWETIAISKDKSGEINMLELFRNDSIIESRLLVFHKSNNKQYSSIDGQLRIEYENSVPILQREGQHIELMKIKNSPTKSNRNLVEQILEESYIVHANIHQTTNFDCQGNSICYVIKNGDQIPYDSSKWFLVEFKDELFFSYSVSHRGFHRVFAEKGSLVFTFCTDPEGINVYKALLKSKN